MQVKKQVATILTKRAVHYLEHDPVGHFDNLMKVGKLLTKGGEPFYANAINMFERFWNDSSKPWRGYFIKFLTELNAKQREKFLVNFLVNDSIVGYAQQHKNEEKYGCNIPWAILMDPTSACNLHCIGCWASEYKKQDSLSFEDMDRVIEQGRKLSCYFYLFSGGEPMMRKKDIIRLCEKHTDCVFTAFTNGTLIDEDFAREMERVGNFFPAISIEGFEKETDARRGEGTFAKAVHAMEILKAHHLAFGFSCCYTHQNVDSVGSEEFIDFMIEKGAWFGWYFTFIPVGTDAPLELMVTPEQREFMYHQVRKFRSTKPLFLMDFWNDGEYAGGCVAGGRRYFHINAAGDAEPCAFIHYSNVNIKEHSVLEALQSPIFLAYRKGQPFNNNMLQPCPLLDNPEKLRQMVTGSEARSTQPLDPENVVSLTGKCVEPAQRWGETAEKLWHGEDCAHCPEKSCEKAAK